MSSWKVISSIVLATVLIFGAGVFTGGFLVNSAKTSHPKKNNPRAGLAATNGPASALSVTPAGTGSQNSKSLRPPEILSKQFIQQLNEVLVLKPDQHEAIQKIIKDGQNAMRKVAQDSRLEIREVLTAEQRTQFDDLVKRPFRKPIFGTNAIPTLPEAGYKTRLDKNVERRTNGSLLSPDAPSDSLPPPAAAAPTSAP